MFNKRTIDRFAKQFKIDNYFVVYKKELSKGLQLKVSIP